MAPAGREEAFREDRSAEAAADAELIVNATSGSVSIAALAAAGRDSLAGRVLLDISNSLDGSRGFPPPCSSVGALNTPIFNIKVVR